MSTAIELLPTTGDQTQWTPQQRAVLEGIGLKGFKNRQVNGQWVKEPFEAPRPVVEMFLAECKRTGLDPIAKEIYCIERGGKWSIEVGINGIRGQADETKLYGGQTPAQWTDDGVTWLDVWVKDTPPAAARVGVLRTDWSEPAWGVATYAGYVPRDKKGVITPTGQWQFNSPNQLAKCAEMQAFRKAFSRKFTGLHVAEEMANVSIQDAEVVEDQPTEDWFAAIRATDDKLDLANLADRIREMGQMTGDLRALVLSHASTLTKDSRPEAPAEPEEASTDESPSTEPADAPTPPAPVDDEDAAEAERLRVEAAEFAKWQAEQGA